MATITLKIIRLERALMQKVAQPVRGLAPEVLKLLAPRIILPPCGHLPLREGSRQRVKTIVGRFRFRFWRYKSFERSKRFSERSNPLRKPIFCGPGNRPLCGDITVRTKPVHSGFLKSKF